MKLIEVNKLDKLKGTNYSLHPLEYESGGIKLEDKDGVMMQAF